QLPGTFDIWIEELRELQVYRAKKQEGGRGMARHRNRSLNFEISTGAANCGALEIDRSIFVGDVDRRSSGQMDGTAITQFQHGQNSLRLKQIFVFEGPMQSGVDL